MKNLFISLSFIMLLSSVCLAQPKSVHYSVLGKYLVDENGQRTHIEGHPLLACYKGPEIIKGVFVKEINGKVYLQIGKYFYKVNKPVCDIIK